MTLNLFFQKKDVDIGCVQVSVEACLSDLNKMLKHEMSSPFLESLSRDMKDNMFKGQHQIKKSKYNAMTCREQFITALIDNISARFRDKHIMTSFCVLGLRPITFLTDTDLESWGNDSIEVLVRHFGSEMSHTYREDGEERVSTSEPVVDAEATIQQYPRESTSVLWSLIFKFHSHEFPNLTKLASLALTHPVHTSDCERAFSSQNSVTTPLRNRLSPEHCEQLMRIMIQAPSL
ncbi:hypothetical protein MAR_015349 [Mya arenaria]|uniref:HAT C-terminal dimerisation domain-containing protein n=1 Tax=Mya arenaria TaxID=6604 RepID=A0ABY7FH36_MYAAR|nr:hypothetical protein MAR_015349 [Mya arenaria]